MQPLTYLRVPHIPGRKKKKSTYTHLSTYLPTIRRGCKSVTRWEVHSGRSASTSTTLVGSWYGHPRPAMWFGVFAGAYMIPTYMGTWDT